MFYYGFDYTYLIFVLPAIVISLFAQAKVSTTFSKYSRVVNKRFITGAKVARLILDSYGLTNVKIEHVKGNLTDHYDPKSKVLRLSDSVYDSASIASLGVSAHECGHAIQHAKSYLPIKIRNKIFPVVSISSSLSIPLIIIGLIVNTPNLLLAGIILFSFVVLFQLITLPVEFNASKRALVILSDASYLDNDEIKGAKKVLSAAALTYVASALTSLMQLLRFLVLANNRRD